MLASFAGLAGLIFLYFLMLFLSRSQLLGNRIENWHRVAGIGARSLKLLIGNFLWETMKFDGKSAWLNEGFFIFCPNFVYLGIIQGFQRYRRFLDKSSFQPLVQNMIMFIVIRWVLEVEWKILLLLSLFNCLKFLQKSL